MRMSFVMLTKDLFGPAITDCWESYCLAPEVHYSKVNQSHYRPEMSREFQEVKVLRLRDNGPEWV